MNDLINQHQLLPKKLKIVFREKRDAANDFYRKTINRLRLFIFNIVNH